MLGFRCICICCQHAAPITCIENITSHLHVVIMTHNFNFDIMFLPISAHTSKTWAACRQQIQIRRSLLSVIRVHEGTEDVKWIGLICRCCEKLVTSPFKVSMRSPSRQKSFVTKWQQMSTRRRFPDETFQSLFLNETTRKLFPKSRFNNFLSQIKKVRSGKPSFQPYCKNVMVWWNLERLYKDRQSRLI